MNSLDPNTRVKLIIAALGTVTAFFTALAALAPLLSR